MEDDVEGGVAGRIGMMMLKQHVMTAGAVPGRSSNAVVPFH